VALAPGGSHRPIVPTGSGGSRGETLRNKELAALLYEGYGAVCEVWTRGSSGRAYQDTGTMRSDVPPGAVARTMTAAAMGFLAQQALFGPMPADARRCLPTPADACRRLPTPADGPPTARETVCER
jgi:hypothetical protein